MKKENNNCNKITLIGSNHKENGNCTVNSLVEIFEEIQPDIIFLEINNKYPHSVYSQELETKAVIEYTKRYNVKTIPIDTLEDDNIINNFLIFESNSFIDYEEVIQYKLEIEQLEKDLKIFSNSQDDIFNTFLQKKSEVIIAYEDVMRLKQTIEQISNDTKKYGFKILNTKEFDKLVAIRNELFKKYIYNFKKGMIDEYEKYYDLLIDKREIEWIKNIKNFFNESENYHNTVLLVGHFHRITLINKLKTLENVVFDFYYKKMSPTLNVM